MATATETTTTETEKRARPEAGELRFMLYNVGWEGYEALLPIYRNRVAPE